MAVLTREDTEILLIRRVGTIFTAVGLDGTTIDGTNTDLNDPIGYGIRVAGGTVSSLVLVTDVDVATVATADYDEYLDLAEYRALENALGNFASVDIKVGPRDEKLSQLAAQLEKMIKFKRVVLELSYGYGVAALDTGTLTYEFAEHDE